MGKFLITKTDNNPPTGGMIVETEAYAGTTDQASHAFNNKRTKRTEVMYKEGGIAYVYLCYGIHHLFNVVTNISGVPHAVLIRALEPIGDIQTILKRRKKDIHSNKLANGPGSLSKALGIKSSHSGTDLTGNTIWIENRNIVLDPNNIIKSPRVGIPYAKKDKMNLWRFRIKNNTHCSPVK